MISTTNCQSENYSLKGEGETTLHILSPCFFSMPLENISKPTVFWCFQVVYKWNTSSKCVNWVSGSSKNWKILHPRPSLFHDFKLKCHNTILIPENIAGKCLANKCVAEHVRKDTLWNFSCRAFHEIWNTFTLVSTFHCVCFQSTTKIVYRESINFDEYFP